MERGDDRGVGNGVDNGRVDLVEDDKGVLVQEPKQDDNETQGGG